MIVEIDCGNTSIKWRVVAADSALVTASGAVAGLNDLQSVLIQYKGQCLFCRICSVRGDESDRRLAEMLLQTLEVRAVFAKSSQTLAGVVNGYKTAQQLGVDRWLALVAAYRLCKDNCLVIDCGTAVTADYVSREGMHLGGVIAPGIKLLQDVLHHRTTLPQVSIMAVPEIANNTECAISAGISSMFGGFIQQQLGCAEQKFSDGYTLVLTGGDAHLVQQERHPAVIHKDLVFNGLALACPYSEHGSDA